MINLSELYVTQNDLRNNNIRSMIEYVKNGGFWTDDSLNKYAVESGIRKCPLIAINKFEDGRLFIHDGHHRAVSTFLAGRDYFREDEFSITEWSYNDYLDFCPDNQWFTPYDPRTHIRNKELKEFKQIIKQKISQGEKNNDLFDYVVKNKHLYCSERDIYFLSELAHKIEVLIV